MCIFLSVVLLEIRIEEFFLHVSIQRETINNVLNLLHSHHQPAHTSKQNAVTHSISTGSRPGDKRKIPKRPTLFIPGCLILSRPLALPGMTLSPLPHRPNRSLSSSIFRCLPSLTLFCLAAICGPLESNKLLYASRTY